MIISVQVENNKLTQIISYEKDGRKIRRRTNNKEKIWTNLEEFVTAGINCDIKNGDYVVNSDEYSLRLKDWNELKNVIPINVRKTIVELPVRNKTKINVKKITALLVSSVCALTLIPRAFMTDIKEQNKPPVSEEIISIDIPEVGDELIVPIEVIEEIEAITINNSFDGRLEQLRKNQENNNIGSGLNEFTLNKMVNFLNSNEGKYLFEYADKFKVDPYVMASIFMIEASVEHNSTIPGGANYNGYGVGLSQIESPNVNREVTAFNYETEAFETVLINMENALNVETNIKIGVMLLQSSLERYNGNIYMAVNSHNTGVGVIDLAIYLYSLETGLTIDEIKNNYADLGWHKYVVDACKNPQAFALKYDDKQFENYGATIRALSNWQYKSYGNASYLNSFLNNYVGDYSENRTSENGTTVFCFSENKIVNENIVWENIEMEEENVKSN